VGLAASGPHLTLERVGISRRVIYRWKARRNPTSMVLTAYQNIAPFFEMAAKMTDSAV
jgi:hypothetical protein